MHAAVGVCVTAGQKCSFIPKPSSLTFPLLTSALGPAPARHVQLLLLQTVLLCSLRFCSRSALAAVLTPFWHSHGLAQALPSPCQGVMSGMSPSVLTAASQHPQPSWECVGPPCRLIRD